MNRGSSAKKSRHSATPKKSQRDYFDQEQQNFDALALDQNHDHEYEALLKRSQIDQHIKKNQYFREHHAYSGTKEAPHQSEAAEQSEPSQEEQDESQEIIDPRQQIADSFKSLQQKQRQKAKLLTEDVLQIDKEDEEYEVLRKKQKTSKEAIEEALELRNQLNLEKKLVDYRYHKQSSLQNIKKYPTTNFPNNQQLHQLQKQLQSHLLTNLSKLISAYSKYSQKVFDTSPIEVPCQLPSEDVSFFSKKLNVPFLHSSFMEQQSGICQQTEKELIKWSHKTNLINVSTSHYSSLLMQTPVGQAKKIVSNWERIKNKSMQKRGTFRILFREEENVRNNSEPQIFDDYELFAEMEKGFISDVNDEQDFRISDTLKYLKNRENRPQKTKEVDRKASKNRKIRFNVHPKLLNFMPSYPSSLVEARDQIVDNFFNCKSGHTAEPRPDQGETFYIDM